MNLINTKTIAAAAVATIVVSLLSSCQGRKMSNMEPTGETVEVDISPAPTPEDPDTIPVLLRDAAP